MRLGHKKSPTEVGQRTARGENTLQVHDQLVDTSLTCILKES